ncbi:MAG: siderophore-interacting protein [Salibacteraceae bacterium]
MPNLPKWAADAAEKIFTKFYHPMVVTKTEYLDTDWKRVCFSGDLHRVGYTPGQVIEFRVTDTQFRHYTPSSFDAEKGQCEVLFYLHEKGPGSIWAAQLQPGDAISLMGPGGDKTFRTAATHHFFFGDETSLGLYANFKQLALTTDKEYLCLLELDVDHWHWPRLIELEADIVPKNETNPGSHAAKAIQELDYRLWKTWRLATFYLTGCACSVRQVRKALRSKGVAAHQISRYPYWSTSKTGL